MPKGAKIFLIEDEEDLRVLAVLQIEDAGYKVVLEALYKEEALRKIEAARQLGVTIAVVDANLGTGPDDGPQIAKALKEAIPGITIISFSGNLVKWGDINPHKTAGVDIGKVITEFLGKEAI